jgi:2-oxo-4-hydroxy-4-carboxy-5-ureidoimidazoline decarboxylase
MSSSDPVVPGSLGQQVTLTGFNQLSREAAIEVVRSCFAVERWWAEVVDARPYRNQEHLLLVAGGAAYPVTGAQLEAALTSHVATRPHNWLPHTSSTPRPGLPDRPYSPGLAYQIAVEVEQYENQFGRPFVICTIGKSTSEIADQLHNRLGNDGKAEDTVIAGQLRQIALLRLTRQVLT